MDQQVKPAGAAGHARDARSSAAAELGLRSTKLARPRLPPGFVPRPHVDALIDAGTLGPLTLVSAGAGWGKTLTTAAWAARASESLPVAWVSLDPTDNQPRAFWSCVVGRSPTVRCGRVGQPPGRAGARSRLGGRVAAPPRCRARAAARSGGAGARRLRPHRRRGGPRRGGRTAAGARAPAQAGAAHPRRPDPGAAPVARRRGPGRGPLGRPGPDRGRRGCAGRQRRGGAASGGRRAARRAHRGLARRAPARRPVPGPRPARSPGRRLRGEDHAVVEFLAEEVLARPSSGRAAVPPAHLGRRAAQRVPVRGAAPETHSQQHLEDLAASNTFVVGLGPGPPLVPLPRPCSARCCATGCRVESPDVVPDLHRRAARWFSRPRAAPRCAAPRRRRATTGRCWGGCSSPRPCPWPCRPSAPHSHRSSLASPPTT